MPPQASNYNNNNNNNNYAAGYDGAARPADVYTLPDQLNDALPEELRKQYNCDASGKLLLYTTPPYETAHRGIAPDSYGIGHSARYLAGREAWLAERERKRKARDEARAEEQRKRAAVEAEERAESQARARDRAADAVVNWLTAYNEETKRIAAAVTDERDAGPSDVGAKVAEAQVA